MRTAVLAIDDATLLAAFRAGEARAFEHIVRRHYPTLRRVAERHCRDSALADDAVQTALIRAHRYLRRDRRIDNLGAWLRRVVTNCVTDLLARERHARPGPELATEVEVVDEPAAERDELKAMIEEAITRLPEIYREPLRLCYLHGVEAREIAERLRDNLNSVKSRLARGRKELRRRLEPRLREGGYL